MKILIISQYWFPENNVPARRWQWLSNLLIDDGHEVTVIAPPPHYQRRISMKEWGRDVLRKKHPRPEIGPSTERIFRSTFFPAGSALTQRALNQAIVGLGSIWTLMRPPKALKDYNPDLIIGTVPAIPTAAVIALIARQFNVPYLVDLRDAWPDLLDEVHEWNKSIGIVSVREKIFRKGPFQVVRFATRHMLNRVLRGASAITVTSSYLARELGNRSEIKRSGGVPEIRTLRNVFPSLSAYQRDDSEDRGRGHLNVLYAGTLGRAQNLQNAIEAAAIAKTRGLTVNLRFVGAGVAKEALMDYAKRLEVPVTFEARHKATDLEECYEWADTALVHLTNWESLTRTVPSKTYELMDAGIHISAVVQGECAELVKVLEAGHVVPPEDPDALADLWQQLIEHPEWRNVSEHGRDWVCRERELVVPDVLREIIALVAEN